MATYIKNQSGQLVRHGVRAIKTAQGVERMASLWVKTSRGLVKMWESFAGHCLALGRWQGGYGWQPGTGWGGRRGNDAGFKGLKV